MEKQMEKEIRESWFKDHKATYTVINDDLKILEWKKEDSMHMNVRYVMDKHNLYITGDLYSAMYRLSGYADLESLGKYNSYYFNSKRIIAQQETTEFDSEVAINDLKNHFKESFDLLLECECDFENMDLDGEEITDDNKHEFCECDCRCDDDDTLELKELLEELIELAESSYDENDWMHNIRDIESRLSEADCEYYDWVFDIGKKPTPYCTAYLVGLQMAHEQIFGVND